MTLDERNKRLARLLSNGDDVIEDLLKDYEKELLKNYEASLTEIKKRIAALFEKLGDDTSINNAYRFDRLNKLQEQIIQEIKKLTGRNISLAKGGIQEIFSQNYYLTGYALETSAEIKLGFALLNPKVIEAAVLDPLDLIKWPDRMKANAQVYARQISQELTQGLIQGDSYQKIARSVSKRTEMDYYRSSRIVRTEGHRVQSASRQLGFERIEGIAEAEGFKVKKKWVATLDGRTRDSHKAMDGKNPDKEGYYTFPSGIRTIGPGLSGVASEDIHCRCTEITEFEDFKLTKRRADKEIISYKTFNEWEKGRIK